MIRVLALAMVAAAPPAPTDTYLVCWDSADIRREWCSPDDVAGTMNHHAMLGLADDDHTGYALLAGRSGGQTVIGGTASGDDLVLDATSHSTTGHVAAKYAGVDMPIVANAYSLGNTTDTRVSNGDFTKTFTIPANSLRAGSTIRIRASGRVSVQGAATNWSVTLNVGGVGHGSTPATAPLAADQFRFDVVVGIDALGAAAACSRQSTMHTGPPTGMTTTGSEAGVTLDTTAAIVVKATLALTAPDGVTTIRLSNLVVDYT